MARLTHPMCSHTVGVPGNVPSLSQHRTKPGSAPTRHGAGFLRLSVLLSSVKALAPFTQADPEGLRTTSRHQMLCIHACSSSTSCG